MEASTVSIDEVRSLVAERQRYDDWLGALEAQRAETPVRVYERVQSDYRTRRDDVTTKLSEHVEMLSTLRTQLDERLAIVDAELTELEDARAEAMLRTAVGEFDSDRWEQVRRDVEAGIEEKTTSRASLVAEVDEVRTLLASAQPVAAPVSVEPEPEVEPVLAQASVDELLDVDADAEEALVDIGSIAPESAPANKTISDASISEWEAVLVTSATSREINDDVLPIAGEREREETQSRADEQFASARIDSVLDTPSDNAPTSAVPVASDDAFDDLAFLRSVVDSDASSGGGTRGASVADQQKTLRCTDCGTMNLPTEWYCERCGGELAAF